MTRLHHPLLSRLLQRTNQKVNHQNRYTCFQQSSTQLRTNERTNEQTNERTNEQTNEPNNDTNFNINLPISNHHPTGSRVTKKIIDHEQRESTTTRSRIECKWITNRPQIDHGSITNQLHHSRQ
nr:MAG: hypothetical protein AmFV_00159 [Apis mellifera filamentous virus]